MHPNRHPLICTHRSRRPPPTLIACTTSTPTPPPNDLPPISPPPLSKSVLFRLSLLSGAVAGFAVDAILFPLDTLKTRLQLATTATAVGTKAIVQPAAWLSSLYAGFGPAVLASAPSAAAFFGTYDMTKTILSEKYDEKYAPLFHMIAAAAGDIAGSTVRSPFEVVKQRLQSGMYSSASTAVSSILKTEGPLGFYRGYTSLVIRELPFDALQFPLYEFFKKQWVKKKYASKNIDCLKTWESCVCGSVAGGISAAVTTPLDVVKTRLMTQSISNPKYHGLIHGIQTIAKEEGPKVLLSGMLPRVVWISLGGAIFFGAYEASKKAITPMLQKSKLENKR